MAVTRFQFRGRLGQRVAEIVEGDAVENDIERIGLVAQCRRRRGEHARASEALPELHGLPVSAATASASLISGSNFTKAQLLRFVCGKSRNKAEIAASSRAVASHCVYDINVYT